MTRDLIFPLLYLMLLLLPLVIIMWRKGKRRFLKHLFVWSLIILIIFLVVKITDGKYYQRPSMEADDLSHVQLPVREGPAKSYPDGYRRLPQ